MSYNWHVSEACLTYHDLLSHACTASFSLALMTCKTIAVALVRSRLDYCNSLLAGTSVSNFARSKYTNLVGLLSRNLVVAASRLFYLVSIGFLFGRDWISILLSHARFCSSNSYPISLPLLLGNRYVPFRHDHTIFFVLVNMYSCTKNRNGKVQIILMLCFKYLK